MDDPSDNGGQRLRKFTEFESVDEDGIISIAAGHPGFCPIEARHDGHVFDYVFLDGNDDTVRGSCWCFGDPAPWAAHDASPDQGVQ